MLKSRVETKCHSNDAIDDEHAIWKIPAKERKVKQRNTSEQSNSSQIAHSHAHAHFAPWICVERVRKGENAQGLLVLHLVETYFTCHKYIKYVQHLYYLRYHPRQR